LSNTTSRRKIILDLCGGTGSWSAPYTQDGGYDVRIIDTQEWDETKPSTGDVRLFQLPLTKRERPHGILAAPPCTHFCVAGARWWKGKGDAALLEGLSVADACLRICVMLRPTFWAIENPNGRLRRYWGRPKLSFDPCDYGDPYEKRTHLWGEFQIPVQTPVTPVPASENPIHMMPDSKGRSLRRSITPSGFARAFFSANR